MSGFSSIFGQSNGFNLFGSSNGGFPSTGFLNSFKTFKSGSYNDPTVWLQQYQSGWVYTGNVPSKNDTIYIEQNHTITLTQNQNCYSLNYFKDSITKVNTGSFTLGIYGILRRYIGTAPGTYSGGANGSTPWLVGNFSLKGTTRTFSISEYVSARNIYGFTTSIDLQDSSQVLTLDDPTKTNQAFGFGGVVNINTGTLKINNCTLRASLTDPSLSNSDGTINVNSYLIIASSVAAFQQINRTATTSVGSMNIANGAIFEIDNTTQLRITSLVYNTSADIKINGNVTLGNEIPASGSGSAIPRNLIIPTGFNYNLNAKTVNIRGTLQGGGTTSNGTLNQNHA